MIIAASCSACGKVHQRNDDRVFLGSDILAGAEAPGTDAGMSISQGNPPFLACVFDGVGGSVRGDKAAQAAAESLAATAGFSLEERLSRCAQDVAIDQEGLAHSERAFTVGAGIEIAQLDRSHLAARIFHMGDCRVYRYRDDGLALLTKDHSLAQRLKDEAGPDVEVPERIAHVVTMYAGGKIEDPFELSHPIYCEPGDIFLLCSDGFWEHAPLEDTLAILGRIPRLLESCPSAPDHEADAHEEDAPDRTGRHDEAALTTDTLQQRLLEAAQDLVRLSQKTGSTDDLSVALAWNAPVVSA